MVHSESFFLGNSNPSLMEGRYNQEKEIMLMNGDAYLDKNYDEDGVNGRTTTEDDEISQNMLADSINQEPMDGGKAAAAPENDDDDGDKAELEEGRKVTGLDDRTPQVGMVFKSYEEVVNFYKRYALRVGFGVAVKKSSFTTYGLCRRLVLVCTKGGKGRASACYQSRPTAKTNCQAMIIVKLWGDGLLHLVEANLEHNHAVSPSTARFLRCYKKMSSGMTKDLAVRAAGHEDLLFGDKDCVNSIEGGRLKLGEGDDEAIHQFFARMQTKNPNFFYLLDLDVEGHLRNVFWADSRSRAAYQYFSDVVYFDTTCLKNKYDIPLALFVGVNHHGQLVLLGCGLVSDETTENYLWLFKAWLTCMRGCPPNAIITDECEAIQGAVAEVFPEARHRICLWHIMKNVQQKLRDFEEYKTLKKDLKKVVYDSLRIDEFEECWRDLIKRYGLEGSEWLNFLYENRQLWAPVFLKNTFWAGMSIARQKESITTFFEGCVYPETSLKCFLSNYEMVLKTKYEMEAQADLDSFHKGRVFVTKLHMEEHLSKLYTLNMFKKFQDELKAIVHCQVSLVKVDGPISTFEVKECAFMEGGENAQDRHYEVFYNVDEFDVHCICGSFEFRGILCRHALSVFKLQQMYEIPAQYILQRWTKDFKQLFALDRYSKDVVGNNQMERYDYLSMRCLQLVEVGMISEEKYQLALKLLREVEKSLLDDNTCRDLQRRLLPFETRSNASDENHAASQLGITEGNKIPNSLPVKRRGRPPKKRKEESNTEMISSPSNQKDSLRASSDGGQSNVFQAASTASHLGSHIRTHGGVDLMEEVNPNDLSFGNHFGLQANHQHHLGNQLQSANLLQSQFGQQTVGNSSGMQWIYQQMLQEDHAPFGRRTG
ncbi:protein FAR1-RELATED SEQUENCE 6-like isoform X1 [Phoenix dactylifera]|uniref:Protein FAR1-RELATED SEQUENCE n=4 Tax=Phoenix dactylifera TaxID=42345 RepID=A0A8B8Z803_PHODC|nr:protein FAR1-RELATED SEQUENCE 6-like isoform X1 [Phoenix dactylifera]XP_038970176.1 protein FAR1-RELATED SEQUENCE 6-like isoform X1 [Phoenix dactylifera]XP_038970178.1 protein FAR1-RELATED SEQUENCE 6-like isoform X1 [Phoenix dactylifera]